MGLCASLLVGGTAFAANTVVGEKATDGKIGFTVDTLEAGEIVKPDENGAGGEVIQLPGQGQSSVGPLRLQFVPNFDFGTITGITSASKSYDAKVLPYTGSGGGSIAPFVQVTNNSGANSKWFVTATATEFKNTANHVLTGAHVSLAGSTLTSNLNVNSAAAGNLVTGQTAGVAIPTDGSSTITVLSPITAASDTNGKQISNVFHDGYTNAGAYVDGKTPGVKFVKPDGIAAQATQYTSTITWSLNDGL